ncbi:fumarylacetoacetate hydrolase family protein [Halalkalibacter kiskunsagensis]|uniref:Fumarylacetoacetate hydrolase family protein n=1 Tax=Halalkalibacter kiskunsagensis TaxID=1548599 RepID=A0ABV6K7A5_9BACI
MKLATVIVNDQEKAAVATEGGLVLIELITIIERKRWKTDLLGMIEDGHIDDFIKWYKDGGTERLRSFETIPLKEAKFAPLYRRPRKIWGVGINYLPERPNQSEIYCDPVSFMKPDTSIIGTEDAIRIPKGSTNTTAEAELAIIIGKTCSNIEEDEACDYVLGYTAALDMTEADIHAENERYLTRAKSFDTFFSFGPYLMIDECDDVLTLEVSTVLNGTVAHQNTVANMRYNPSYLVAFHSKVMTLLPGDIILTGTPGPVVIRDGDVVESRISGFDPLVNEVPGTARSLLNHLFGS